MYSKNYTKGLIIKKSIRKSISFRIDEKLLKEFDETVKKTGIKKTFIVEKCLENYVKNNKKNK